MKADLSRTTFNRLKHFSRVVAQQGRVQLDADWNEQSSIMLYQLRRLAADVIGPAGGPAGNLGFGLDALDASIASGTADFSIGAGHYYVDGILCELDATWLLIVEVVVAAAEVACEQPKRVAARQQDSRASPGLA